MSLTKQELVARLRARADANRRSAEEALARRDWILYERAAARAEAYELAAYDAEELADAPKPIPEFNTDFTNRATSE